MPISDKGLDLLKQFEGCRLQAYRDSAGIPTIGFGSTRYADGTKVQMGDVLTQAQADDLLKITVARFAEDVDSLTTDRISQGQLDALTALTFNIGVVAYRGSTLRQRVNNDPNDPSIRGQFMRWNKARNRFLPGLWLRRHQEADLYFNTSTPCPLVPTELTR